jgi:hypothetical protein
VFRSSVNGFSLNLPSNISAFSPTVRSDLARQIELHTAASSSLARKCRERTGEAIAYMGMLVVRVPTSRLNSCS